MEEEDKQLHRRTQMAGQTMQGRQNKTKENCTGPSMVVIGHRIVSVYATTYSFSRSAFSKTPKMKHRKFVVLYAVLS